MNCIEIIIETASKYTETVSSIAQLVTSEGLYIEDYSQLEKDIMEVAHTDLIDKDLKSKARDISKIHLYVKDSNNIDSIIDVLNSKLK